MTLAPSRPGAAGTCGGGSSREGYEVSRRPSRGPSHTFRPCAGRPARSGRPLRPPWNCCIRYRICAPVDLGLGGGTPGASRRPCRLRPVGDRLPFRGTAWQVSYTGVALARVARDGPVKLPSRGGEAAAPQGRRPADRCTCGGTAATGRGVGEWRAEATSAANVGPRGAAVRRCRCSPSRPTVRAGCGLSGRACRGQARGVDMHGHAVAGGEEVGEEVPGTSCRARSAPPSSRPAAAEPRGSFTVTATVIVFPCTRNAPFAAGCSWAGRGEGGEGRDRS